MRSAVKRPTYGIVRRRLRFPETERAAIAHFRCAETWMRQFVRPGVSSCAFTAVPLNHGDGRLEAWLEQGENAAGVRCVTANRLRAASPHSQAKRRLTEPRARTTAYRP